MRSGAGLRCDSIYLRAQAEAVAAELLKRHVRVESGKRRLAETRRVIEDGWHSVAGQLVQDGRHDLANDVRRFVERLPAVRTERELVAQKLIQHVRGSHVQEKAIAR